MKNKKLFISLVLITVICVVTAGCGKPGINTGNTTTTNITTEDTATEEVMDIDLEYLQGKWYDVNGETTMELKGNRITFTFGRFTDSYTVVLKTEGSRVMLANADGLGFEFISDLEVGSDGSLTGYEMVLDAAGHKYHFMREEQLGGEKEIVDLSKDLPKTIESTEIKSFFVNFSTTNGRSYGMDVKWAGAYYGWQIEKRGGVYLMDFSQSYDSYMGIGYHGEVSKEYVDGLAVKIAELGLAEKNGYYKKNNVDLPGYYLAVDYESGEKLRIQADGNAADTCVFDLAALMEYAFEFVDK